MLPRGELTGVAEEVGRGAVTRRGLTPGGEGHRVENGDLPGQGA